MTCLPARSSHCNYIRQRLPCAGHDCHSSLCLYQIPSSLIPTVRTTSVLQQFDPVSYVLYTMFLQSVSMKQDMQIKFPGYNACCKHSIDKVGVYCKTPLTSSPSRQALLSTFWVCSVFCFCCFFLPESFLYINIFAHDLVGDIRYVSHVLHKREHLYFFPPQGNNLYWRFLFIILCR